MITVCAKNRLKPLIVIGQKQLGPDNNTYLAQIITPKMAKLGPDNNFTANIYIYIYAVESKLGPKIAFFESKLGPSFLCFFFFCFFQKSSSFCRENEIFKKTSQKKRKKNTFFASKLGPILLRNILGPSFDSTLDQVLTQHFC